MTRIAAIDLETPNGKGDAICQIGFVIAEDTEIRYEGGTLVDPETWFDPYNCSIHGILPKHVEHAPTFPEVWEVLAPHLDGALLVAHNAPFDLGVLRATLLRYRLPAPDRQYCCTVQMARRRFPRSQFGSYRLNDLADGFSIPLDAHHDAVADAKACYLLYRTLLARYGDDPRDIRTYPPKTARMQHVSRSRSLSRPSEEQLRRAALCNILQSSDLSRPLPPHEAMALSHWVMQNEACMEDESLAPLFRLLYRLLSDGLPDADEQEMLLAYLK